VQPKTQAPFHGYFFRMLDKQGPDAKDGAKDYLINGKMVGGFAFVAYPAEYGNSGVMTFMVGKDRVIYQQNLGKTTSETAPAMTDFKSRHRLDQSRPITSLAQRGKSRNYKASVSDLSFVFCDGDIPDVNRARKGGSV